MHILNTPIHVCQNFVNIYLTFVAYSSKTMSEMTQLTLFSRLCQKRNFLRLFLNLEKWCDFANKIYISISNVSLSDTYISLNMNLVCHVALYLRKENRGKICTFS